jgi:hypothetical protein
VGVLGSFLLGSSFSGVSFVYSICTLGLFSYFNKIAYFKISKVINKIIEES